MDRRQFLFGLAALAVVAPMATLPGVTGVFHATPGIAVVDGMLVKIEDNLVLSDQSNGIYVVSTLSEHGDAVPLCTVETTASTGPVPRVQVAPVGVKTRHTWPAPRRRTAPRRGA